jgi:hypothetical protein
MRKSFYQMQDYRANFKQYSFIIVMIEPRNSDDTRVQHKSAGVFMIDKILRLIVVKLWGHSPRFLWGHSPMFSKYVRGYCLNYEYFIN